MHSVPETFMGKIKKGKIRGGGKANGDFKTDTETSPSFTQMHTGDCSLKKAQENYELYMDA